MERTLQAIGARPYPIRRQRKAYSESSATGSASDGMDGLSSDADKCEFVLGPRPPSN